MHNHSSIIWLKSSLTNWNWHLEWVCCFVVCCLLTENTNFRKVTRIWQQMHMFKCFWTALLIPVTMLFAESHIIQRGFQSAFLALLILCTKFTWRKIALLFCVLHKHWQCAFVLMVRRTALLYSVEYVYLKERSPWWSRWKINSRMLPMASCVIAQATLAIMQWVLFLSNHVKVLFLYRNASPKCDQDVNLRFVHCISYHFEFGLYF